MCVCVCVCVCVCDDELQEYPFWQWPVTAGGSPLPGRLASSDKLIQQHVRTDTSCRQQSALAQHEEGEGVGRTRNLRGQHPQR